MESRTHHVPTAHLILVLSPYPIHVFKEACHVTQSPTHSLSLSPQPHTCERSFSSTLVSDLSHTPNIPSPFLLLLEYYFIMSGPFNPVASSINCCDTRKKKREVRYRNIIVLVGNRSTTGLLPVAQIPAY